MQQDLVKFNLVKIVTNQFATLDEPKSAELSVNFTHTIQGNYSTGDVLIIIAVKFLCKSRTVMTITTTSHFKIDSQSWNELSNDGQSNVVISKELNQHLSSIAIGVTRGALHSKTENTIFNQYFVPLVDISQMVKADFVVEKR